MIEEIIKDIVRQEIAALGQNASDPVLISVDEAAAICGCDKSVIHELVKAAPSNGFPSVRLGARTIRIDKRRLSVWFAGGGLGAEV